MQDSQKQHGSFEVELQPDYSFSHNGYGLLMLNATFAQDAREAATSQGMFARGAAFPNYARGRLSVALAKEAWTCVKAEESGRDGNVIYVKATFAAISTTVGGTNTETECTITGSAVSEPIETHPNFTIIQMSGLGSMPLGGELDDKGPPLQVTGEARNPYRAKWTQSVVEGVVQYQFQGFLPAQKKDDEFNRKAGVKSYFRPSIVMKLTGYTTDATAAQNAASKVGWRTFAGSGFLKIPESYQRISEYSATGATLQGSLAGEKPNYLITSSNMEVYGGLFKVTVDMMLSGIAGWDADIYREETAGSA